MMESHDKIVKDEIHELRLAIKGITFNLASKKKDFEEDTERLEKVLYQKQRVLNILKNHLKGDG